jgi:3-dehydroquinate synthase
MEDSRLSNQFSIRSYRRTYTAEFVADYAVALRAILRPGDFLILDQNVVELHPPLRDCVAPFSKRLIVPSEPAKSYDALTPVIAELIERRFTKTNRLVAIGGGVTQDITAFIASILLRGVEWIFFPTNLLAQCDSCIGSKTSINFGPYKNQLGGFYPPKAIFIDVHFLKTLPPREIRSGIGEMIHYFLVKGETDLVWAEEHLSSAFNSPTILLALMHRSLAIKKEMVERDEFDEGPRNVFNYGHSFGHALESTTGYTVPHGIAVSFGMDLANCLSARTGLISMALRNRMRPTLAKVWEGTELDTVDNDSFLAALARDKKNEDTEIKVILTRGPGAMFKTSLVLDAGTRTFIARFFQEHLYQANL